MTSLDIAVEDVGDRDGGPNVCHVVRSPNEPTNQEEGGVEVGENLELLAEEVEGDGQDSAQREAPQEAVVDGTGAEHLLGTESTREDGSRDKRDFQRAREEILLRGRADVGDLGRLVIENGRGDEGGDESCPHLAVEGDPWSDVYVVRKLEILSKVESIRGRDKSVGFEVVHSSGVTREPEATEKLGDNVQGNLSIRDGHDDAARDAEDHSEEDCRFS